MSFAICLNYDQSKILLSGKGLSIWTKAIENIVGKRENTLHYTILTEKNPEREDN